MIVEAFVSAVVALIGLVFSLMGSLPAPGFVGQIAGSVQGVVNVGSSMGVWVPWSFVGGVVAAVLGCWGISLVIRVVRIVASFLTAGGGGAA